MDIPQEINRTINIGRIAASVRREALRTGVVVTILALALGLRFYGLNWDEGFAWTPHPDERAILSKVEQLSPPPVTDLDVLLDADESPWNPRWFPYGSFPLYFLRGVQLVSEVVPGSDITDLRVTGRAISALADVTTVFMVFTLGSFVYGRRVGILAAAFASLAVLHIQLSHFFAVDTFLALFTIAAMYFMFRVAREGRMRDSVLAGVFVGLGLATKVSQAPIYAPFVISHIFFAFALLGSATTQEMTFEQRLSIAAKGLGFGVATSLVVLFIVQPYAFLDWSRFYADVTEQSEMIRRIRDYPFTRQYVDTTPYLYHIRQLATWGLGWPLGLVAWAGMLYVSVRGMRWNLSLLYLIAGWGLPAAILIVSSSFLAIFVAAGIALVALLATLPFRSADTRIDVLLLSWAVPFFLINGAFEVKFMRYLIPLSPFLILFGSRMMFALWDRAKETQFWTTLRPVIIGGFVAVIGFTAFYALSYMGIYGQTHTAVRASDWINQNAPVNSTILKEHWEEGLPNLHDYRVIDLPLYDPDGSRKTQLIADRLASADYITFYSNRLYATIPRLPERYPITTEYYKLLFTGQLGYELVEFEATYPEFLGVSFADNTFDRQNIPEPLALQGFKASPISFDLGFADESFSVYDHPKVLVFENTARLNSESIKRIIENAAPGGTPISAPQGGAQEIGLLLSPEEAADQQQGGTWTDIVNPNRLTARLPIVSWLVLMQGFALLVLPITFVVFRPLADRGYLFSKALGLLLVGLIVWLMASVGVMDFSRAAIAVAILLLGVASAIIVVRKREELTAFVKERWPVVAVGEAIFLVAFFSFLLLRMANPDLWHPWRGGEKPMDFAYLNAVLRSTSFPPYDPWFAGGYINYYYWGQFIVATLIRATGVEPTIAYNLAIPMFFALTVGGAFSIVYNLAEGARRRLQSLPLSQRGEARRGANPDTQNLTPDTSRIHWSPVIAGIAGAMFVTVLGNMDGVIQILSGTSRALFQNQPFGEFDFWRSSRLMPSDLQGITEFPFFTFLFADLHAHLMALPYTLLTIGLALALVIGAVQRGINTWDAGQIVRLAFLGVAIGSLRVINTWDYPTYLIIGVAAVFLAELFAHGGVSLAMIFRAGLKSIFVFAVGYIVFLPFIASYETFFNSVERTTATTILWRFLAINGLFIFVISTFFISESRDWLKSTFSRLGGQAALLVESVSSSDDGVAVIQRRVGIEWVVILSAGALLLGIGLTAVFTTSVIGSTIPFVGLFLVLVAVTGAKWIFGNRPDSPYLAFVVILVAVSFALVFGLDIFRVEGDIDRMNSIFKFYLQIWVMLALASAFLLWRMAHGKRLSVSRLSLPKQAWVAGLVVLVLGASIYPILGTQDRLRDRFYDNPTPLTIDGAAYIEGAVYRDQEGEIDLEADYEGIRWLQQNVKGSPIIVEGVTPTYRWGGRVSINTGLPTIIGWQWHQQQQRWDYRHAVDDRIHQVDTIYGSPNPNEVIKILRDYGVKYVYVGELERNYYSRFGIDKFSGMNQLTPVFQNEKVTIYRVDDENKF